MIDRIWLGRQAMICVIDTVFYLDTGGDGQIVELYIVVYIYIYYILLLIW